MTDILAEICSKKLIHITKCKREVSENTLLEKAKSASPVRGFERGLKKTLKAGKFVLIAEIKKASPSKGLIRNNFNPPELAKAYENGGATCLSVLTDTPYFQGKNEYLVEARNAVNLPVLRKDFILDPYQIVEARALGSDCILLIMAALSDNQAKELEETARALHMDVLIETHNEVELERALSLKSKLIGINNRNLKTLEVSLATTENLAPKIPDEYLTVCESGIYRHEDLLRMKKSGVFIFLVGESLMRQEDVAAATKALLSKSLP